jgi:hypothetical protein
MKANEAPEKIYVHEASAPELTEKLPYHIEYTSTDAFIEKAKKWFEEQNEWFDPNGVRHCGLEDFEDFKKYMKGE